MGFLLRSSVALESEDYDFESNHERRHTLEKLYAKGTQGLSRGAVGWATPCILFTYRFCTW